MPIDYSKWDNIELSDDEDFECHPNVDKKSMVRWKQAQVHKERRQRTDQRDLLALEKQLSDKFITEFPLLVEKSEYKEFNGIVEKVEKEYTEPIRSESLKRINEWPENWDPPSWGDVLRDHRPWHEKFKEIVESSSSKEEVLEKTNTFIQELINRQSRLEKQIATLEQEMNKKLTVDHLKTGFDKTVVRQEKQKEKVMEVIHTPKINEFEGCDMEQLTYDTMASLACSDEEMTEIHPKLIQLCTLSENSRIFDLLKAHGDLLTDKVEETLLLRALALEILGKSQECRNCVKISLITKYTRELGPGGLEMFFSKFERSGSEASKMFMADIEKTMDHMTKRGKILRKERIETHKKMMNEQVQQQKKMVDFYKSCLQPDGSLELPLSENPTEKDKARVEWFKGLPHYYKEGLLLQDVEAINKYLGSLGPEEAEVEANKAVEAGLIQFQEEEDE